VHEAVRELTTKAQRSHKDSQRVFGEILGPRRGFTAKSAKSAKKFKEKFQVEGCSYALPSWNFSLNFFVLFALFAVKLLRPCSLAKSLCESLCDLCAFVVNRPSNPREGRRVCPRTPESDRIKTHTPRVIMKRLGLIGWRGMVGSVLMDRMKAEND